MTRALSLGLAVVCLLAASSAVHADPAEFGVQYSFSPGGLQLSTAGNTFTVDRLLYNTGSATLSTDPTKSVTIHTFFAAMSFGSNGSISTPVSLSISGMANPVTVGTLSGNPNSPGGLTFTPNSSALGQLNALSNGHGVTINYNAGAMIQAHWMGIDVGELTFTLTDPPLNGGTTGGTTASTPEPSSLAIAGIGVPLVALFISRRRRAARTA